ncbi:MAG TPA: protein kinase, partial [Candidatus Krumholzibacteria bacterium]|nr:protein kinase [Candidatus Krumholzibacteria bacterium]
MINKSLGHYKIISLLGSGGMGEVYRARDTHLGRDVAIKILPAEVSSNAERMSRFEHEARTLSAMNHPNLATLFELGSFEGAPYMVMELIDGETLRTTLDSAQGALRPRRALEIAVQIAQGLSAAHGEGVIHRDLKPENILITQDGRVKILDFGLAKLMAAPAKGDDISRTLAHETEPGVVMGTVGYMSPEQVRGGTIDHRSDIFSLGVVLYEMLSGQRAFQAPTSAEIMTAILHADPPALDSGLQLSPSIERIVRRCLEKEPQRRFQSAHDLAYALEAVKDLSGEVPRVEDAAAAQARRVRMPLPLLVIVAVAAVAIGVIAGHWLLGGHGKTEEAAVGRMVQLTFDKGAEVDPSVSPDGNAFVYVAKDGGDFDIFQQRVGGENRINLTADCDKDDVMPAYSPDGTMIAFRSERDGGGIFVMGATGESVRRLSDFGFNPSWSPDGQRVLFGDESIVVPTARNLVSKLWSVDVHGGQPGQVFAGDCAEPVMSPNGKFYAFWGLPPGTGKRILSTLAVAGGDAHPLDDDNFFNWNPTWSGDGRSLYFTSNRGGTMDLWRMPMDPETGRTTGKAQPVTMSTVTISQPSITHDGSKILYGSQSQTSRIVRMPIMESAADQPVTLIDGSRDIWEVEASPDGQWLALKAADPNEDLLIANVDGSGLRRLTNDAYKDREPCFTPDSKKLYFFSDRTGRYEVWSIRIDGSELTQITDTHG